MRILMAGDVHADAGWAEQLCHVARELHCSTIAQLGDFGYWEHMQPEGPAYLDFWELLLERSGLRLAWIDGNHENHTLLRAKYKVHPDLGWARIRNGLYYISRGARWKWDGVTFLGVGGAFSIDKQHRKPGRSWWPEEMLTVAEAERAKAGGHVDVMLTHDCPAGVDVFASHHSDDWLYFRESEENRELLLDVVEAVRPDRLYHGHFHVRHSAVLDLPADGDVPSHQVAIEGLANNRNPGAYTVFDTVEYRRARVAA